MTNATTHGHIVTDDEILDGEPVIKGTRTPIRAIIENWRLGGDPEEILVHLPHLNLSQVFDALSYYAENQEEINRHIERNRIPDEMISSLAKG